MLRFGTTTAMIAACALGATGAFAQSTMPQSTTPPAQTTPPQTTPPQSAMPQTTPPTTAAPASSYTDTDIDEFATAAIAVQKIQQDSAVPDADKQTQMAAAVKSSGLTADKFNAIARASQSDPALMKRIQTAAASKMQAAPSTAPGSTGDNSGDTGGSGDASGATGG